MSPPLIELLDPIRDDIRATRGPDPRQVNISGIAYDSRRVAPGMVFVAVPGFETDGHRFIEPALGAGAAACVLERLEAAPARDDIPLICVGNARRALALCSARLYDWPGRTLTLVGVTGTNGKTSTSFLVEAVLRAAGRKPALIGTIETHIGGETRDARNTTPESLDLQQLLAEMRDAGHDSVSMEVSSHALVLDRVAGCRFAVAVFTNLTQDHLDFHGNMDTYHAAKRLLFSGLDPDSWAIINADDPHGAAMRSATKAQVLTYGIEAECDVRASDIHHGEEGTRFELITPNGATLVQMRLAGRFNVYNALAASAVGLAQGIPLDLIGRALNAAQSVRGRFETVHAGQPFRVIVDYAHTPDGLDNVLRSARAITVGRVIVVFGCGGDRDRTKRPLMGSISRALADLVYVTSDNPRTEDAHAILRDIVNGIADREGVAVIADRREAIEAALSVARPDDCVVVAGKGHETYQIVGRETILFDDVEVCRDVLRREFSNDNR